MPRQRMNTMRGIANQRNSWRYHLRHAHQLVRKARCRRQQGQFAEFIVARRCHTERQVFRRQRQQFFGQVFWRRPYHRHHAAMVITLATRKRQIRQYAVAAKPLIRRPEVR